ncbi:MAG: 2'-5' RNA ligase family protein, partial [Methanobacterium sp.]
LGMDNFEPFSNLQKDLDEDFIKMGFKKERSYTPHLTIGRVKGAKNKAELLSALKDMGDVEIGEMDINRIVIKKSELTPVGPIYTTLKEFVLK